MFVRAMAGDTGSVPLTRIAWIVVFALLAACTSPPPRQERPLPELFAAREAEEGARAQLAERLDAIPEGDGTVLDHCVMMYMSEMRTHDHDAYDLPIVLLGGDGVFLNDAHVAYDALGNDRQLRDLWFTVMNQYYGLGVASFGDDLRGEPNRLLEEILR